MNLDPDVQGLEIACCLESDVWAPEDTRGARAGMCRPKPADWPRGP